VRLSCLLALVLVGITTGCAVRPCGYTFACGAMPRSGTTAGSLPVVPSVGFLIEQYRAPLSTDVNDTTLGTKVGTAKTHHVGDPILTRMPLVTWGDLPGHMGVDTAAASAGIKTIRHIDYERFALLGGLYVQSTIIVYGD